MQPCTTDSHLNEGDARERLLEPLLDSTAPSPETLSPQTKSLSREGSMAALVGMAPAGPEFRRLVSYKPLLLMSSGLLVAVLVICGVSLALLVGPDGPSRRPHCRKSSLVAVLGSDVGGLRAGGPWAAGVAGSSSSSSSNNNNNGKGDAKLLVWSGIGLRKAIFDDLHTFSLGGKQRWKARRPAKGPRPVARWKAGNAQSVQGGMVVVGGDAYTPGTRQHKYRNDVWMLGWPSLEWHKGRADPFGAAPHSRRGHSTMLYKAADGSDRLVLFGGRTKHTKTLLNDAWEVSLAAWPNVTWSLLAPMQQGADGAPASAPAPRRGHSAVLVSDAATPQMLVYGGREELDYFGDIWLLDIEAQEWCELVPSSSYGPPARDHHSAAYQGGKLYIWGGHSGPSYYQARPMNDLWAFDLRTLAWQQIPQRRPLPLPRFEQSSAQYTPPDSRGSRLLVFGGQTAMECQLNDVWQLDLDSLQWSMLSPPRFCTSKCREEFGGGVR